MRIYVIGGKARSGKNTFGDYLREELKEYGYRPCVMRITDPLYGYARNYFEWDEKSEEKPREFLQKMGIEIIKEKLGKKDFLLNRLHEDIEILSNFFDVFIITDARLVDEFKNIKEKYDEVITIKLERNSKENNLTEEQANHITEKDIDKYNGFDFTIENKSLEELKKWAVEIIRNVETERGGVL